MRLLVVHAWLRGNLGDVLQLSVLLAALRELSPQALDLAGFPRRPGDAAVDVVAAADRYLPDPFAWYWKFAPGRITAGLLATGWRRRRRSLFAHYDAIVCAPGPYLAEYDLRAPSALADIATAADLGVPVVLSSHSVGPLPARSLATVARASLRVAREPATHAYLGERDIGSVLAADLAFLYPYEQVTAAAVPARPYRLVFLRSNNLDARTLRLERGALYAGSQIVAEASDDPIVLATSDVRRDARFLAGAARRLDLGWIGCRSVAELVELVRGAASVVSDRYHPAICAAVLGKPARTLPNREPHKMEGLADLLAERTVAESQALARAGLSAVAEAIRGL